MFQVGNSDTLEKIALQFNLTPSELLQLNKLNTRIVFPGQVYLIFFSIFIDVLLFIDTFCT